VFAQFETDVRRERQAEGIAKVMSDPVLRRSRYFVDQCDHPIVV